MLSSPRSILQLGWAAPIGQGMGDLCFCRQENPNHLEFQGFSTHTRTYQFRGLGFRGLGFKGTSFKGFWGGCSAVVKRVRLREREAYLKHSTCVLARPDTKKNTRLFVAQRCGDMQGSLGDRHVVLRSTPGNEAGCLSTTVATLLSLHLTLQVTFCRSRFALPLLHVSL